MVKMNQNNEKEITNTKGETVDPKYLTENINNVSINNETIKAQPTASTVAGVTEETVQPVQPKRINPELEEVVVGKVQAEKESSPLAVFIIFALLALILLFLPIITEKINEYLGKENIVGPSTEPEEILSTELVDFTTEASLTLGYFTLSDFSFVSENNDTYLNYTIKKNDETSEYSDNLYIELHSSKNIVALIKVISNTSNNTANLSALAPVNYNDVTKLKLVVKNETDYPDVFLNTDGLNEQTLTCSRNNYEYNYKFSNQVLYKYTEIVTVIRGLDEIEYQNSLQAHQSENAYYNNYELTKSSLIESDTGYTIENEFTLKDINESYIKNNYYFQAGTKANEVSFIMEATGYDCR